MIQIKIHSDYVCPFCYLHKERLRQALESIEGAQANIEVIPFELRRPPTPKVDPLNDEARLVRFKEIIKPEADALGLPMNLPNFSPHPYTTLAFQGYYFAKEQGLGEAYNNLVFTTFYVNEKDIGELPILDEILINLGLDPECFHKHVEEETYMPILNQHFQERSNQPFQSIPSYYINDKLIQGSLSVDELRKELLAAL